MPTNDNGPTDSDVAELHIQFLRELMTEVRNFPEGRPYHTVYNPTGRLAESFWEMVGLPSYTSTNSNLAEKPMTTNVVSEEMQTKEEPTSDVISLQRLKEMFDAEASLDFITYNRELKDYFQYLADEDGTIGGLLNEVDPTMYNNKTFKATKVCDLLDNMINRSVYRLRTEDAHEKLCSWFDRVVDRHCAYWRDVGYQNYFLHMSSPKMSTELPEEGVVVYATMKDRRRDRRTRMKIGKYLKRLIPHITYTQLTRLVNEYKENFGPTNFVIETGETSKFFADTYNATIKKCFDIYTSDDCKSLANSCMNKFGSSNSPVRAYGSGDFILYAVRDQNNLLCARVIACKVTKVHGPIYTTSNNAYTLLKERLEADGFSLMDEDGFAGAKLLAIKYDGYSDRYSLPYVDWHGYAKISDCKKYFTIVTSGSGYNRISLQEAGGYATLHGGDDDDDYVTCNATGERIHIDDFYTGPDGYYYSSEAFHESFFFSDYNGDPYHNHEAVTVHTIAYGRVYDQLWSQDEAEMFAVSAEDGNLWRVGDTISYVDTYDNTKYLPNLSEYVEKITYSRLCSEYILLEDAVKLVTEDGDLDWAYPDTIDDTEYVYMEDEDAFVHINNFLEQMKEAA